MDDWIRLNKEHPKVAFNYKNFNGTLNSRENGFEILVQCEPWTNMPQNFDLNVLKQYRHVITFNRKFYEDNKDKISISWMRGVMACNTHKYHLISWPSYEERLNGVCMLNNHYSMGTEGDILWLRPEIMANLDPALIRHIWCPENREWGGECYQGQVESPVHHSHINHLKKISEYRFCICFESTFHPYWSWDFITERIFNCFKAKTIPIYIGCYNICDHIPDPFYIDFRSYFDKGKRDYEELSHDLLCFPPALWEAVTEEAYKWSKQQNYGSVEELEEKLASLGV